MDYIHIWTVQRLGGCQSLQCEGEVDFICQVPNLICYQLLIIQASYQ
jgi:hypothetical protein